MNKLDIVELLKIFASDYSSRDNVAFEYSDVRREVFVRNDRLNDGSLITKSNLRLQCESGDIVVTATDGTRYEMTESELYAGPYTNLKDVVLNEGLTNSWLTFGEPSWYVSKIEDLHGNTITASYLDTEHSTDFPEYNL